MYSHKTLAIGADIGGSHISCAAVDLENLEYLSHTFSQCEVDNHASPEKIIGLWSDAIRSTMELAGPDNIRGIGFAMPGPFDYVNGISLFRGENGKFENTYGLDVPVQMKARLKLPEDFTIRFINDATAFAIGEDRFGKGKGFERILAITLGTGFGSAFLSDHLPVLDGPHVPYQGCLWHIQYEDGIADDYFSTRGFLKRFKDSTGEEIHGVKQLAERAATHVQAMALFEDFGFKMGRFLKPRMEKFSCELLVMGGNISNAYPLFKDQLLKGLDNENFKVETSKLQETASMIGSAFLVDDIFYKKLLPLLSKM